MSHVPATDAPTARQARHLAAAFKAKLLGRQRGPDHAPDRRVPRRNSYEENDARAQPWRPIGDGSAAQGLAHREALTEIAGELHKQGHANFPLARIREQRQLRDALAAELDELAARSPADVPIGRPATIRTELARLDAWLKLADGRIRRIDVDVLKAIVHFLHFATGRLIPAIETIARQAACHRNSVIAALRRLKQAGLIDWVRRTVRTGAEGEFAPQLEQTSNAYFFDHKARMDRRVWQRYWQRLCVKLRRLGAKRPDAPPPRPVAAAAPLSPLQAALASLGSSVGNAST